jgi:hypothetical protein
MRKTLRGIAKFIMAFYVMTIVCTIAWEVFVDEKLYNSTDGVVGYWTPGDWVDNWDGQHPIAVVPQIIPDDNMNDPDTIKEGWTAGRLLELWFCFFGSSVAISAILAWLPWPRIGLLGAKRSSADDKKSSFTQ